MNNVQRVLYIAKLVSKQSSLTLRYKSKIFPCSGVLIKRHASTNEVHSLQRSENLVTKLRNRISFIISKHRLNFTGYMLFESIADHINYTDIFQKLNLPDTFYSWFVITELHIWMVIVRYMAEGDEGHQVRNRIVEALWTDVNHRVKKLCVASPAGVKMQVSELSEQLHAALVAYDEGLQSSDTVLAGALWRRIYQQKSVDPECLDALVKYIRRHMKLLDNMTKQELFEGRILKWEPLKL